MQIPWVSFAIKSKHDVRKLMHDESPCQRPIFCRRSSIREAVSARLHVALNERHEKTWLKWDSMGFESHLSQDFSCLS